MRGPLLFRDKLTCEPRRRRRRSKKGKTKFNRSGFFNAASHSRGKEPKPRQSRVDGKLSVAPNNNPVSRPGHFKQNLSSSNVSRHLIAAPLPCALFQPCTLQSTTTIRFAVDIVSSKRNCGRLLVCDIGLNEPASRAQLRHDV